MMKTQKKTIKVRPKRMSRAAPLKEKINTYNTDFVRWIERQTRFLKKGAFAELDIPNLIEEIRSLGKNDKRTLKSQLTRLLMHLLKQRLQPEKQTHSNSWTNSIVEATREINYLIEDSPSLRNELKKIYPKCYEDARRDASTETGLKISRIPEECPWEIHEILPFLA
jgi:hypothetical protein